MNFNDTLIMVSTQVGQPVFEDLLMCLPDAFFDQDEAKRAAAWRGILAKVNQGERDPKKLAALVILDPSYPQDSTIS